MSLSLAYRKDGYILKSKLIIVILIACMVCIAGCNDLPDELEVENTNVISGEAFDMDGMTIYTIGTNGFNTFVENPSMEILSLSADRITHYVRSETAGNIEYFGADLEKQMIPEGVFRIEDNAALPLYGSLIDFTAGADAIAGFLLDKGIREDVKNHAVVYSRGYPLTIWVETFEEHYFITVDEYVSDYHDRMDKEDYIYRMYTGDEYLDKVLPKAMLIYLKGNALSESMAKLNGDLVEIPLVAVLSALDCEVHWNEDETELELILDSERYALCPAQHSLTKIGDDYNYIMTPPGGVSICDVRGGEVYIDSYALETILKIVGATVEIDNDAMKIVIEQA